MAFTHELALDVLESTPQYQTLLQQSFGEGGINIERVTEAIAAFEETLVTPDSRFDRLLRGDDSALTADELKGYQIFKHSGCVACHNGPAVGGASYQKMGVFEPYQTDNPAEGRVAVTGIDSDRFMLKFPTLRNVELIYPYFNDGAVWTLEKSVDLMGRLHLGRSFKHLQNTRIVAFLKTLTGRQPTFQITVLPPSSNSTPRPKPFQ